MQWKKAKHHIDEHFFHKLGHYVPFGPKDGEYKEYQRLSFIEKNIESIEPEHVDEYSIPLGKLFRWLQYALELRKEDVQMRRD